MSTEIESRERFRKGFVLIMTLAYAGMFFVMIDNFVEALLLAAVFSGIVYPLYSWLLERWGGRSSLASIVTLLMSLAVIVVPLILLLGLVADQALEVAEDVTPWLEQQLDKPVPLAQEMAGRIPFADQLEPYREKITAKLGEFAGSIGIYLAGSLGRLSEGTMSFFMNLFVMLYAMFFFLISGKTLVRIIMGYAPLSEADKQKMLQVALSVSRATVKGTLIIGIIQGTLGGLGFAVAGIEASVFWGALMAVLSILPGIGATLVWAPAVVYLLLTGESLTGLGLLLWSAGVVGTIDNVLRPILVGRDSEMPDLLILLSTLGGLAIFGVSGLVLGPMIAALFIAVLAIYSRVFADWLNPDQQREESTGS